MSDIRTIIHSNFDSLYSNYYLYKSKKMGYYIYNILLLMVI